MGFLFGFVGVQAWFEGAALSERWPDQRQTQLQASSVSVFICVHLWPLRPPLSVAIPVKTLISYAQSLMVFPACLGVDYSG
jgi:hypothetical protein